MAAVIYRIINADVMDGLASLPDESVQCCITSPPYWGLRDYGTATWVGGDAECGHMAKQPRGERERKASTLATTTSGNIAAAENAANAFVNACGHCGAIRIDAQLGLESTPDAYVARMVEVFREVRRVLRKDGTLWLNIGSSYASDPAKGGSGTFKQKDLVPIPWMLAMALQADGWYLRSDIIWSKPNPMPESVTDRPTKAHEYLFLLTKSAKYYYDAAAIAEDSITGDPRAPYTSAGAWQLDGRPAGQHNSGKVRTKKPDGWATHDGGHGSFHRDGREKGEAVEVDPFTKRNRRSVWTITPRPFKGAHFATFPPALIEPCILAGSKPRDTILDPFIGSGTTACVALQHDRDCIGIDLSRKYIIDIAVPRIIKETGTEPLVVG